MSWNLRNAFLCSPNLWAKKSFSSCLCTRKNRVRMLMTSTPGFSSLSLFFAHLICYVWPIDIILYLHVSLLLLLLKSRFSHFSINVKKLSFFLSLFLSFFLSITHFRPFYLISFSYIFFVLSLSFFLTYISLTLFLTHLLSLSHSVGIKLPCERWNIPIFVFSLNSEHFFPYVFRTYGILHHNKKFGIWQN